MIGLPQLWSEFGPVISRGCRSGQCGDKCEKMASGKFSSNLKGTASRDTPTWMKDIAEDDTAPLFGDSGNLGSVSSGH